jgi:glutamate dehydrogenase (NAD(P)+)
MSSSMRPRSTEGPDGSYPRAAARRAVARPGHLSPWKRYAAYLRTPPELVIAWNDRETGARAWLVINSLRGGAAGGGTRMRIGLEPREVTYLAKAMELKFAISGPAIGGAKNGIDFDPADPRKPDVLERWYRALAPLLRDRYGTGGDLNVDEVLDVIPAFERIGLGHPQDGVVRGHLQPDDVAYARVHERLGAGVSAPVPDGAWPAGTMTVADLVTGYGVAAAVRRWHECRRVNLAGVRIALEGFGNVGAACGLYLARAGARIVALRDARRTLLDPDGLDAHGMEALLARRTHKLLPADEPRVVPNAECTTFHDTPADVFVCAAISESLTPPLLDRLEHAGVRVLACGANQPFREANLGATRVAQYADRRFAVLADIVANCGMARTFSYLMESQASTDAECIFAAVDSTIVDTVDEIIARAGRHESDLLAATLALTLDRIGAR